MKMKMENRSNGSDINEPRPIHKYTIIKSVSVWWCHYALSNT